MANYLIDTNVMMAAKADPDLIVGNLSFAEVLTVHAWFVRWFHSEDGFVSHSTFDDEYRDNTLSEQDFPMLALRHKMDMDKCVHAYGIEFDREKNAIIPDEFDSMDQSDKKWVAAALQHPEDRPIVNCADSDWDSEPLASTLRKYAIRVETVRKPTTAAASDLPEVVRAQAAKKKKKKK
jgi:hypothetical protein